MPGPALIPGLPDWLNGNSLLASVLSDKASSDNRKLARKQFASQKRTIFLRDTELFVANGRELRCVDLKDLKIAVEKGENHYTTYQSLELPNLDFDISQVIRSADGETAIVVGEYDVGIALLPAPGVVTLGARSKIPLKCFKLEPDSTHERSKVMRAIFHPLGARPCVVVLTEDAMIHLYEIEFNRNSISAEPTESLDLKLMLGIDRNSSYLCDDIEPTSICFGGVGSIWSIFTLYILMRNGEIYSICPFLPSKWMLDSDFLEELKFELQANQEIRDSGDTSISALDKHNAKQICFWIHEISRLIRVQNLSNLSNPQDEFDEDRVGYFLPKPSLPDFATPILQGPYLLQPAPPEEEKYDESTFASDIARIGASGYAVIAVAWSHGKVDLMLEFDIVAPRWHSNSLKYKRFNDRSPYPIISGYETINISLPAATEGSLAIHPSFTVDINFPNTLLLSHGHGVELLNLGDWMTKLTSVMDQEEEEGAIEAALAKAGSTTVTHMMGGQKNAPRYPVLGTAMVYDSFVGYLFIGATTSKPSFALLKLPSKYHSRIFNLQQERSDLSSNSSRMTIRPPLQQIVRVDDEDATAAVQRHIAECRQRLELLKQVIDPRILRTEPQISADHINTVMGIKNRLSEEMDARWASAVQIHALAVQQQKRFHEQINNIRRFQEHLLEREKQQQEIRDKIQQATDKQQVFKERVEKILSKLSAISRKGGYSSMSQAEQEYAEELGGIEKIVNQIEAKEQKIMDFMATLGRAMAASGDAQQVQSKGKAAEPEAPDSNRDELSKMVQKEHRLIIDTRKKIDHLERQFSEVRI